MDLYEIWLLSAYDPYSYFVISWNRQDKVFQPLGELYSTSTNYVSAVGLLIYNQIQTFKEGSNHSNHQISKFYSHCNRRESFITHCNV